MTDPVQRDVLIKEMQARNLFPSQAMTKWENETGAYPETIDPEFLQKLLTKREFAESLQQTWKPLSDPCNGESLFEVTPVQRFVTNFMSPKTPYMSALLYHGVGVGKTCAAIQITEAWLEFYPHHEVYLVAPPTIQQGFLRTIFDINKVTIGSEEEPNTASQCTGTTYLKLTNTLYERDKTKIEKAVQKMIRRRYKLLGYVAFANFIKEKTESGIPQHASDEERILFQKKNIRSQFSGKLLIVDEAHNLRDITSTERTERTEPVKEDEDAAAGKLLTPLLKNVLQFSEGMKFCALTATPMYNSYEEIIFMLNLLLMNDKKGLIRSPDVFDMEGNVTERGTAILSSTAKQYVSFMRGENPISFPVRLFPEDVPAMGIYPTVNPRGAPIQEEEKAYFQRLPMVPVLLSGDTLRASIRFAEDMKEGGTGLNTMMMEKLVHAGNFIVPATDATRGDTSEQYTARTDRESLLTVFDKEGAGFNTRYRAKPGIGARWLAADVLREASPKFEFLLQRLRQSEGCSFVYSRFVNGGALPLALVLEANGYTPYHGRPLLADGNQVAGGKQCARCSKKQQEHSGVSHAFTPAYYGLLTGSGDLSPNNEATIVRQRSMENKDGVQLKVLLGSQIASEGVDLRFIRETHILDSWFHLNKTEQIIGRAIRFLSHCALPKEKRNTTIYLYAAVLPPAVSTRETGDLYSYRVGFNKAVLMGKVTRIMKQSAIDCNLNLPAIVVRNEAPIEQEDSQRKRRMNVNINDMPFTAVCDWIETCDYTCKPQIEVLPTDDSTYDEYSARWRMDQLKQFIRELFEDQAFYQSEDLWNLFLGTRASPIAITDILQDVTNNKGFQIQHQGIRGYIRYCNGYYLFQPNVYADLTIPLAIRVASFPIKRDQYLPMPVEPKEYTEEKQDVVREIQPLAGLWNAIVGWITALSRHQKYIPPPHELQQRRLEASHDSHDLLEMYKQILEVIQVFYDSFDVYHNAVAFRTALLFYFWDDWFTMEEQKQLVALQLEGVQECIAESQFVFGETRIQRWLNPRTGAIEMICKGAECMASVVEEVNRSKTDALRILVNHQTTGFVYGFMVPKDGGLVFKTNEPPEKGGVMKKGKECGNVSNLNQKHEYMIRIGDALRHAHQSDCHLDRETILKSVKIKNTVRFCTIMNLFFRFLDAERLERKRWFYRPVHAFYTQHRGTLRQEAKK